MRQYGLIGNPLSHSFSKQYFIEKFEREGLKDCFFELYPLGSIQEFPALVEKLPGLKGVAVTIPFKETVIPYLQEMNEAASAIGAVNCIAVTAGSLKGYNTDAIGFERSLKPLLKPVHHKALILGTGGASKAVQFVLQKMGISFLIVSRKNFPQPGYINYKDLDEQVMNHHTVVINCTPVGMYPEAEAQPAIPYQYIGVNHLLYDLIYKPENTLFMMAGKAQGATVKNGYEMLCIQAEENWKIWNTF